jgi:hypothetical protein
VFASYEEKTQTACIANRLKHFDGAVIEAYDDDKEFYVINRACTFFRPTRWNEGKPDTDKARDEVKPVFGIFLDLSNCSPEDLPKTIESIKRINYDKGKIIVTLCHLHSEQEHCYTEALGDLLNDGIEAYLTISAHYLAKEWDNLNKLGRSLFFSTVKPGQEIDPEIYSDCDTLVNDEGKVFATASKNDTIVFLTKVFLQHHLDYNNFDEIKEALVAASEKEGKHVRIDG